MGWNLISVTLSKTLMHKVCLSFPICKIADNESTYFMELL